jgi:CIC family chloride channel protein
MANRTEHYNSSRPDLFRIGALAVVAGVCIGLLGAVFRLSVDGLTHELYQLYAQLRDLNSIIGFLMMVLLVSLSTMLAIWLVRRFSPAAAGSGIPQVEALWQQEIEVTRSWLFLPVKFISGLLALSLGYALGREGPVVQMGAWIGDYFGRLGKLTGDDRRLLMVSMAGAGLAVAFSAPLAGMLFAIEELTRSATARLLFVAMLASAIAVSVGQLVVGSDPIFQLPPIAPPSFATLPLFLLLGLLCGLLGMFHNAAIVACLHLSDRLSTVPLWLRAGGAAVLLSLLLWYVPSMTGDGQSQISKLFSGNLLLGGLCSLLIVRFALGPLSYALGMSGGLFAPMIALGAIQGALFGLLVDELLPGAIDMQLCMVAGMAGIFASSVRAPLTGIVLIIEMTGVGNQPVSLLLTCIPAIAVPYLLGRAPIYDSLLQRQLPLRA